MPSTTTDRIDGLTTSVAVKAPCRVATSTNIGLSSLQTIGGITVEDGDRVLVVAQTDSKENGIYVAHATAWERARDFDGSRDVVTGTLVVVRSATGAGADTLYRVTSTSDPIVFGSSAIAFEAATFLTGNATNINFTQAGTGAVTRTTQNKMRDYFSVKDYGATGDGSTDDTDEIQAGIDYLHSIGGGVLHFPAGVYKVTSLTLKQYVILQGEGLATINSGAGTIIQAAGAGVPVDTPAGSTFGIGIRGIYFRGVNGLSTRGVRLRNVSASVFEDLFFVTFQDEALICEAGLNNHFIKVGGYNCVMNRSRSAKTGAFDISGTDHRCYDVEFTCSQSGRSDANLYVCAIAIRMVNGFCDTLVGHTSDVGIYIASAETRYVNCRALQNFGPGYDIPSGTNQITNCYASQNSLFAANTYDAFALASSQGNILTGCRAANGSHRYGFSDTGDFSTLSARNQYFGCRSANHVSGAFSTVATNQNGSAPVFSAQMLKFTNGDTTPSVEQTTLASFANYASPTTVTYFDDGLNGQHIVLLGNSNVTLQNNASFILTNTGADKTLRTNVLYYFQKIGSTWCELMTHEYIQGSATFNPSSLADGAGETTTVTVTGAALGDFVEVSFSLDLAGITLTGYVSAANTVSVRFQNETGGVVDLGSGTLRARVRKSS
jgi:hypothetical protein